MNKKLRVADEMHLFCNSTSAWPSCLTLSEAFFTTAFMLVVMMIIVLGNLVTVVTVNNDPKLRSQRQNWLICSLAFADMLVGLLIMPLTLGYDLAGTWILGDLLCELWLALDVLFVTASILHICIISLDRYWSVTYPLSYPSRRTPTRIASMIGIAWLVSLLISIPPLIGWKSPREPGKCSVSEELGYVLYSSLGSFYIPVVILVIVYWRIYEITKHHSRQRLKIRFFIYTQRMDMILHEKPKLQKPTVQPTVVPPYSKHKSMDEPKESSDTDPDAQSKRTFKNQTSLTSACSKLFSKTQGKDVVKSKKSLEERRRVLKVKERQATFLLGIILGAFIASWFPFFALYVLGAFGCHAPILIFKFFFWLGYCNSGINPIIYTVFNREFRRGLLRIMNKFQKHCPFIRHLI